MLLTFPVSNLAREKLAEIFTITDANGLLKMLVTKVNVYKIGTGS